MAYMGQVLPSSNRTSFLEIGPIGKGIDQVLYQLAWTAKYQDDADSADAFFQQLVDQKSTATLRVKRGFISASPPTRPNHSNRHESNCNEAMELAATYGTQQRPLS